MIRLLMWYLYQTLVILIEILKSIKMLKILINLLVNSSKDRINNNDDLRTHKKLAINHLSMILIMKIIG